MHRGNAIAIAFLSLVALAASVPMVWFTIHESQLTFTGPFGNSETLSPPSGGMMTMALDVTGLNGTLTLLVELPIWGVVAIGGVGVLLALSNRLGATRLPGLLPVVCVAIALVFTFSGLAVGIASSQADLGAGAVVASLGLLVSVALLLPARATAASS